ncbi:MAG: DUF2442 domain-containing protein [bacterium]|nr:DUF2442 domain-containing protein [bacterium]
MIHLIKEIKEVSPFKVKLKFNTGEIKEVDLERKLKEWSKSPGSVYKQLLEPEYFKNVKLNTEMETIYWDNGIDLCPDVLYSMVKN